jgi:hypothetical protein
VRDGDAQSLSRQAVRERRPNDDSVAAAARDPDAVIERDAHVWWGGSSHSYAGLSDEPQKVRFGIPGDRSAVRVEAVSAPEPTHSLQAGKRDEKSDKAGAEEILSCVLRVPYGDPGADDGGGEREQSAHRKREHEQQRAHRRRVRAESDPVHPSHGRNAVTLASLLGRALISHERHSRRRPRRSCEDTAKARSPRSWTRRSRQPLRGAITAREQHQ